MSEYIDDVLDVLDVHKGSPALMAIQDLLRAKLNQYKDKLVSGNDDEIRGRAKECKELLSILS